MTVLILGGTREARDLAEALHDRGLSFHSSLAGRVQRPRMPVGETRFGGFGGVDGLARYLVEHDVEAVVDATHPFAETISANARSACGHAGVPLLRLARPGWEGRPGAERWHWVDDHDAAAQTASRLGRGVLLTTGRQNLDRFTGPLCSHRVVARVVDPVAEPLPPTWTVVLDRGPYQLEDERRLMRGHQVDVLVTKDSGGDQTSAKLTAADELGVEVVVVRRGHAFQDVATVTDVAGTLRWLSLQRR